MKRAFAVVLSVALMFFVASDQSFAAFGPISRQEKSPTDLHEEIVREARKSFESQWLQKDGEWFGKIGREMIAVSSVRFLAGSPMPPRSKRLPDNVEWYGYIEIRCDRHKIFYPDLGWSEWCSSDLSDYYDRELLGIVQLIKRNGTLTTLSITYPRWNISSTFPLESPTATSALLKPTAEEVALVETAPTISHEKMQSLIDSNELQSVRLSLHPQVISQEQPRLTDGDRSDCVRGKVVLSVEFKADGTIGDIRIVRSLGLGRDQAAIAAARTIRFHPAMYDGKPLTVRSKVEFEFD